RLVEVEVLAGPGARDGDAATALRRGTDADDIHVLVGEGFLQVGDVRDAERFGEALVKLAAAAVDIRLVGGRGQPATRVGGESGGVVFLVRVAAGDEQHSIARLGRCLRPHGAPPSAASGRPERRARSIQAMRSRSGLSAALVSGSSQSWSAPAS